MLVDRLPIKFGQLNQLIDKAIFNFKHNVIIIWGELGDGKTSLALQMVHRKVASCDCPDKRVCPHDWDKVLSFELEPHTCLKCGEVKDFHEPYKFEVPCPKCSEETKTKEIGEAISAVLKGFLVEPFPLDIKTGLPKPIPKGTTSFTINTSKARGKIVQKYPYLNFTFFELRDTIKKCVNTRARLPITLWDDIAVYFHRSNIQYMNPEVKSFFSRYNFVREYVSNLVITVPTIDFVPEQLSLFCTADVLLKERGLGDFDTKRYVRSFWGRQKSWQKSYDGRNVTWKPIPEPWFRGYEEIRHAHAVEAFEKPEEMFVIGMPKTKAFTEEESLF